MARHRIPPPRQPLLFQPVESLTGFSFAEVVDEARALWFPEIEDEIEVRIGAYGALAFVCRHLMGPRRHVMVFHPVLNLPGVPAEVVRMIAKHELTHIVRPPIVTGDGYDSHHAEFWRHEFAVAPERHAVWAWVFENLPGVLRSTWRGVSVHSTWRRRVEGRRMGPYTPHLPFDDVPWSTLCPEGGAQLRLPPGWAWRPALADSGRRRHRSLPAPQVPSMRDAASARN